jgi:hypothetical protein
MKILPDMEAHTHVIPALQEVEIEGACPRLAPGKSETLSEKKIKVKKIGGMAPVVECLQA